VKAAVLACLFFGSIYLYAEDHRDAWLKLLSVANSDQKALLLEEGCELNYRLPEFWKTLWEEPPLRPFLLKMASPEDLSALLTHSPLNAWSKHLRRQLWIECWILKQKNILPSTILEGFQASFEDEAPWLTASSALPQPSEVKGEPLAWGPIECQAHLTETWNIDIVKQILASKRYDLNFALSEAWIERKETLGKGLYKELWINSSMAGRSAITKILIESPSLELLESTKSFFKSGHARELCLRIFKAMNPPPLSTWLLDQFDQKKEPWKTLALYYMIDARDVEHSKRYLDLYLSKLVKKNDLPKDPVVILMGMSKHPDVIPILSKLLRTNNSPVSPSVVIQAMAEHGDASFLKTIERLNKREGSPLTEWALERLQGKHQRAYRAPAPYTGKYHPTFKSLR